MELKSPHDNSRQPSARSDRWWEEFVRKHYRTLVSYSLGARIPGALRDVRAKRNTGILTRPSLFENSTATPVRILGFQAAKTPQELLGRNSHPPNDLRRSARPDFPLTAAGQEQEPASGLPRNLMRHKRLGTMNRRRKQLLGRQSMPSTIRNGSAV